MLGVRSIYMNDNEHAIGNIPAFICATKIMVPEFLGMQKLKQGANPKKVIHYPGVKEGIYLWELDMRLSKGGGIGRERPILWKVVYIRPEPWTAQYYKGDRNFLDALVLGIQNDVDVVLLPRGKEQGTHYQGTQVFKYTGGDQSARYRRHCSRLRSVHRRRGHHDARDGSAGHPYYFRLSG